jgi:hypothetical protein
MTWFALLLMFVQELKAKARQPGQQQGAHDESSAITDDTNATRSDALEYTSERKCSQTSLDDDGAMQHRRVSKLHASVLAKFGGTESGSDHDLPVWKRDMIARRRSVRVGLWFLISAPLHRFLVFLFWICSLAHPH